ncbi:MAG: hypothetical protein JW833_15350, partial [Prolixibacteraceae bacterium]|nr:hypothetical protein [Prolixibacteraceae bacterium]
MKGLIIVGILVLFITACSVNKGIVQVSKTNEGENVADTTEYELITFDGKFEAWYSMNDSPAMYRSKEYYESWNKRYVTAWNI